MKSFLLCGVLPFFIQSIHAKPAAVYERAVNTTCLVDQLTPQGTHISYSGSCGAQVDIGTMALRSPVCSGATRCIVPRADCMHPGGGKCVHWSEKCSVGTYTLGKDNDVCPQNLKCCEGTISSFEDVKSVQWNFVHRKPWTRPWTKPRVQDHCGDTSTTAQAKIINSKPKAKAIAAKAVSKILHKVKKDGPYPGVLETVDKNDYQGEHQDLVVIWKQFLHLLETPEGQAPQIATPE